MSSARYTPSIEQSVLIEPRVSRFERSFDIRKSIRARDDPRSTTEAQEYDAGLVTPENETRELFGFLLDEFHAESCRTSVEVQCASKVGAIDDVLDRH